MRTNMRKFSKTLIIAMFIGSFVFPFLTSVVAETDVLVAGGGTAGVVAAIAAARNGASGSRNNTNVMAIIHAIAG